MKRIATIATMLVLTSALAHRATAEEGVLLREQAGEPWGNYCHMKFPAIDEKTLAGNHPQLKPAWGGDVIDFYGPCDESPTGQDQVIEQRQQESAVRDTD